VQVRGAAFDAWAATSPASLIKATTLLTATVSPSWTLISVRTPSAGRRDLRIDLVGRDLEERLVPVDRVADLLDPATIVPSAIDSPIWGIVTSVGHHDL
jgi:hypothetical protein